MEKTEDLSPEAQELFELLKTLVSPERFCYDMSKKWRYLCATPQEHAKLCKFLGIDVTTHVKFGEYAEMDARDVDDGKKPRKKRKPKLKVVKDEDEQIEDLDMAA